MDQVLGLDDTGPTTGTMAYNEDAGLCGSLPTEVLCRIFSYLDVSDRLAAGMTCKTWYTSAVDSRIYKDVVVTLEKNIKERMLVLLHSNSIVTRLVIKNCALDADAEFWQKVGHTLKSLELIHCSICWTDFVSVLEKCRKLVHLAVIHCDKLESIGEPGIADHAPHRFFLRETSGIISVDLSNTYLTDAVFHEIMTVTGKVRALSLEGCRLSVHDAVHRRFYPPGGQVHSPLVFTLQEVLKTIENAPIQVLNLSRTIIDNRCIAKLSATFSKTLREFHAASCVLSGVQGVTALCTNTPKLTCLNLGSNPLLGDDCLEIVCESLRALEQLDMSNCIVSSMGFANLVHLKKLQCADFSNCILSEEGTMVRFLSSRPWPDIQALNISSCRIGANVVKCLSEHMPTLVSLDVSHTMLLTDEAVRAIWTHLRLLRVLRMGRCPSLTNAALHHPSNMKEGLPTSMASLGGLKELCLGGCSLISDAGVLAAMFFRELAFLDLGHCPLLTSASLKHIALHCPSLSKLVLRCCVQLDDDSLTPVLRPSSRLRQLDIGGCRYVTDGTLLRVAQCPSLKYVNVTSCMVTQDAVQHLQLERPDLEVDHSVE